MTEEKAVETTETTEQPVDPQLQQRIAYTETLQAEIKNLQEADVDSCNINWTYE